MNEKSILLQAILDRLEMLNAKMELQLSKQESSKTLEEIRAANAQIAKIRGY